MTHDDIRAEARRLGDELTDWIHAYDKRGKTYRQFWADHAVAAGTFEALLRRPDTPEDVREEATLVYDVPIHMGFEPENNAPPRALDDLIEKAADSP